MRSPRPLSGALDGHAEMVTIDSRVEVGSRGEDCIRHRLTPEGGLIVLADGAGGTGNGAAAAALVCEQMLSGSWTDWTAALLALDGEIAAHADGGTTTAVVVEVRNGEVCGASVGDSGAWILAPEGVIDLTEHQERKPLLGSGLASPRGFGPAPLRGRLLVASDGLFKYAKRSALVAAATSGGAPAALEALVAAVRMRNGKLQDDVAVALCEDAG